VSENFVQLISFIYKNATAQIKSNAGLTKKFNINGGVLQGESLSLTLFNIYLNDLIEKMDKLSGTGITLHKRTIHALLFADDIVLLSTSPVGLQKKLNAPSEYAMKNDLKVNTSKTQVMVFRKGGRLRKADSFTFNNQRLEIVSEYKYLEVVFQSSGKFNAVAKEMRSKGNSAAGQVLNIINKFNKITLDSAKKIFHALTASCALYCVSIWGFDKEDELEKIQVGFYKRLYCLPVRTPSYLVRLEFGLDHIKSVMLDRRLRLLYRLLKSDNSLATDMLWHMNRFGRQDTQYNWLRQTKVELGKISKQWILDDLNPDILAEQYIDIMDKYKNHWHEIDPRRAKNSTYLPNNYYKNTEQSNKPENYLLLPLTKNICCFISSLRLNPWYLFLNSHKLLFREEFSSCKFCPEHLSPMHVLECNLPDPGSSPIDSIEMKMCVSYLLPGDLDIAHYKSMYLRALNWFTNYFR